MTRSFLAAVVITCATLACSGPDAGRAPDATEPVADAQPNVLFVFYDQYRSDIIGAYGGGANISTPHIDRIAREGTLLTNGLSTTPVCTPYRGMLMTGRYATHTGLMLNFLEANTTVTGIADVFRDAGYRTAFMGKWHLAAGSHKMPGSARRKAAGITLSRTSTRILTTTSCHRVRRASASRTGPRSTSMQTSWPPRTIETSRKS